MVWSLTCVVPVAALRYNLTDNGVDHKATVLEGDCRTLSLERIYDRVSLGILPSSEGGWPVAKAALSPNGGWLHIHGNVPVHEIHDWSRWVAWKMLQLTSLSVLVHHVEKVKSFAPKVYQCVADVQVGYDLHECLPACQAGLLRNGVVEVFPAVYPPSCALSDDGVLHQHWMQVVDRKP